MLTTCLPTLAKKKVTLICDISENPDEERQRGKFYVIFSVSMKELLHSYTVHMTQHQNDKQEKYLIPPYENCYNV